MTTALITGVNGQDGSYLAEFLLRKGYTVIGTVRGKNPQWPYRYAYLDHPNFSIAEMSLDYHNQIARLIHYFRFLADTTIDECYNLAAQSHVGISFMRSDETYAVTGVGACLLMEEYFNVFPLGKFYQASTSEMFGNRVAEPWNYEPLHLNSGFAPASPYAIAKLMAHHCTELLRDQGKFVVSGILFNHESERRHHSFVTQKIAHYAASARIRLDNGIREFPKLHLGNIHAYRDWGYAPQYVEIMWRLLQEDTPQPVVVGTGRSESVEYFARNAFEYVGLDWLEYTEISDGLIRPRDVDYLCADGTVANMMLGDGLIDVDGLIPIMVNHQLQVQTGEK